jgi:DNA-binding NarL/FixJ family response regulator
MRGTFEIAGFCQHDASFVVSLLPKPESSRVELGGRDQLILESLLSGRSQKQIGYDFELAPATVSGAIQRIRRKLGATCWEQLIAAACALGGAAGSPPSPSPIDETAFGMLEVSTTVLPRVLSMLTPAEREVALCVVGGASNAQIGRLRRTSARTVANQISSLFRKLEVRGRLELILRMFVDEAEKS